MLKALRKRMTYANVAMTLALVFAMTGGAYAAKKYLITSTKQISPSVLKALAGKRGPAGTQGSAGPSGKDGANGAPGAAGKDGKEGAAGKGVTISETTSKCAEGGITVTVEGSPGGHEVCNGEEGLQGKEGKEGALGTAGTTLPKDATETGTYSITNASGEGAYYGFDMTTISFTVPLAAPLDENHVLVATSPVQSECENSEHPGAASVENPEASSGYLCVYPSTKENMTPAGVYTPEIGLGSGTSGAVIAYEFIKAKETGYAFGTWAVTG